MACATVSDILRQPTEYLGEELHRRASWLGIWLNLIPRAAYPLESGTVLSTFVVGRSEPTSDEETWSVIQTLSGGSGSTPGACATTWNDVSVGYNETTYRPEAFGLRGPVMCTDEMIYTHNVARFIEAYLEALRKRVTRSIENRLQNLYTFYVPKHVTVNATTFTRVAGGTGFPPTGAQTITAAGATCELSQEHLDRVAVELNQEGANMGDTSNWITLGDNGPEYPLYIGQEMSQQIVLNNSEFRQDIRWGEPNQLLKRMGASRVVKSFRHIINLFPPRFNYNGTTYSRVPTWRMVASSKGLVSEIHPEYEAADFEAAYVLNPLVFTSHIVPPRTSVGGLNWNPLNYMGEWQWVTGGKEITDNTEQAGADCYDPLKKLGRHFAEYKHAPEPIHPIFGRMLLFRRCVTSDWPCNTCFGT